VIAAHGRDVDAESVIIETIDMTDVPIDAPPVVEVVGSRILSCGAAPSGENGTGADGGAPDGTTEVDCRIRILVRAAHGSS